MQQASPQNVIITGVPRSGTTLTCHLLNKVPNVVALHEPMIMHDFETLPDRPSMRDAVDAFYAESRRSLLASRTVTTKQVAGKVPDNPVHGHYAASGKRESRAERDDIVVDKPLTPDFVLCVKHPSGFSALLDLLVDRYPCYAIVRNPLSVLASWNSVSFPVSRGHAPAAERVDRQLQADLAKIEDLHDRQLHLLSWFFGRYRNHLPDNHVIRYEDIVATGGSVLKSITPAASALHEPLQSQNVNKLYDRDLMRALGHKLLQADGAWWHYFGRDTVEKLIPA
jgi:hypothetical protein